MIIFWVLPNSRILILNAVLIQKKKLLSQRILLQYEGNNSFQKFNYINISHITWSYVQFQGHSKLCHFSTDCWLNPKICFLSALWNVWKRWMILLEFLFGINKLLPNFSNGFQVAKKQDVNFSHRELFPKMFPSSSCQPVQSW